MLREALSLALGSCPSLAGGPRLAARVERVRIARLSALSGEDVCGGGDLVAGVLARFQGRFAQVGLFAMDPEAAFALVRGAHGGSEPLAAYRLLGAGVLALAARAIDDDAGAQEGEESLQEDSVIGTLLRTHAPSDAVVVAFDLALEAGESGVALPAHAYMLADAKPFLSVRAPD